MDVESKTLSTRFKNCDLCNCNSCYDGIVTFSLAQDKIVIPAGQYCYFGSKVSFEETKISISLFEKIYMTSSGPVLNENITLSDGTKTQSKFNSSGYDWFDLFGYYDTDKFIYFIYEVIT
jgi:hypothetical protein